MKGTASGAKIAPTFEPELKMPVARARSFFGNHSATVLIAAGKLPASLNPRLKEYNEDHHARGGRHGVHGNYCVTRSHKSLVWLVPSLIHRLTPYPR